MRKCSPCLFYDDENHIWRFYVNDNNELMYNIMYAEDKWTKEKKIDNEVLDFTINFDKDNNIYIIYSVKSSILKYCIFEENKWFGKMIYSFENEEYEMTELKVITRGDLMHIFFIEKNNNSKTQCSLMHLCLNNDGNYFNTIDTIPFIKDTFSHYQVQNFENNNLSLIFIKREKNEVIMFFTEYKNNKWTIFKKLYGIIGNNINFCTMLQIDKINIMNLSKENSLYSIEHVVVESDGKIKSFKIQESFEKPTNYFLIEISGVLWAIWTEGKNILSSWYNSQWSEPINYYTELNNEISLYKYLSLSNKNDITKCKYVLGSTPPEIKLLLPKYRNNEYRSVSSKNNKVETTTRLDSDTEINKIDMPKELLVLQKSNTSLGKKLIDLQIKYQQKLRIIEETDNNFFKLATAKKKAEEKLNIISEIQHTSIKKLEVMKIEKISMDIIINELKNKSQQLANDCEGLNEQKIFNNNVVIKLKNKLQQLISEKEGLRQDLKYEKNIGIVDRIFKKRPER